MQQTKRYNDKKGIIKFALALYTLYGMLALRFRTLLQVSSSFELFLIGTGIKRHYFVDQKKKAANSIQIYLVQSKRSLAETLARQNKCPYSSWLFVGIIFARRKLK